MSELSQAKDSRVGQWLLTGFGGCAGFGPFERVIGWTRVSKNGSYLQFAIRFPGEKDPHRFSMLQSEFRSLLASGTGPFRGHGLAHELRVETDVAPAVAYAEWGATRDRSEAEARSNE